MALTKCRECGKDVSTTAATCPHCGVADPAGSTRTTPDTRPVVEERTVVEKRPVVEQRQVAEERPAVVKRGGGFARFLLWIILIMFLVVLAAWYFGVLNFG